jgi:hypothetical protein
MVDTSGSMTEELGSNNDTGADGSFSYTDGLGLTRSASSNPGFAYGEGFSNPANSCSNPPGSIVANFRGQDSRLFHAKSAVNNVLNGSGEIDWGLMRYAGNYCAISAGPLATRACTGNGQCHSGTCTAAPGRHCTCANDNDCNLNEFCVGNVCKSDPNLCELQMYSMTDGRTGSCMDDVEVPFVVNNYSLAGTYGPFDSCGTTAANCRTPEICFGGGACGSGGCTNNVCVCSRDADCNGGRNCVAGVCVSTATSGCGPCQNLYTCSSNADCLGGSCNAISGRSAKACGCSGNNQCDATQGYTCQSGVCTYAWGCISTGGIIEVDPKVSGSNAKIFPWVDGKEDYTGAAGAFETFDATGTISTGVNVANPELRSRGFTPLGGSARTAANWYATIRNYSVDTANNPNCTAGTQNDPDPRCDPKIRCRPYVLVQLTDGVDTCEGGNPQTAAGPVAGAREFVNATVDGARLLNKVYIIGLSITAAADRTELTNIAVAGGTSAARFANSQADIEAALSDIVTSSVLVEKCNNADDDCNGACDEPFPDVAVTGAGCNNPRGAKTCNNGALAGTHCFASGSFQCSSDGLSEVCSAPTCTGDPEDTANPNYAICARQETMHGCNGLDDDCNGVVDDCTPFVPNSCCSSTMCPACNPTGIPQPETCNGCDDDCDGKVDNNLMDPAVGVVGGPPCVPLVPGHDQPPCNPGITACVNGEIICENEVTPMPNQCDGISRDCTGVTNTSGNCPANFMCFQGNCVTPCLNNEFPCPGGYVCKQPENLCIPDACNKLGCPTGDVCQVASDGTAMCVDPCSMVSCPSGYVCQAGVCKIDDCRGLGCMSGQICLGPDPPTCQPDPCASVNCPAGQFCDAAGNCEHACQMSCGSAQVCVDGQCQQDPCLTTSCPTAQVCVVVAGSAACVESYCDAGCGGGLVCCGGQCRHDPCAALSCAPNQVCTIDHACSASCRVKGPDDQIVGAGGGGFVCEMGGRGSDGGLFFVAMTLLAAVWFRRREAR